MAQSNASPNGKDAIGRLNNKYIYKYINMHIYVNEPRRNKFEGVSGSGPIGGKSIKTCRLKMNATPV